MSKPLRWAVGQSPTSKFHVVVADLPPSPRHRWGEQLASCGHHFVQFEEWIGAGVRDYLRDNACPKCAALHAIPSEDDEGWEGWEASGIAAPLFPERALECGNPERPDVPGPLHPDYQRWVAAWLARRA